jgi:hypothetical protein
MDFELIDPSPDDPVTMWSPTFSELAWIVEVLDRADVLSDEDPPIDIPARDHEEAEALDVLGRIADELALATDEVGLEIAPRREVLIKLLEIVDVEVAPKSVSAYAMFRDAQDEVADRRGSEEDRVPLYKLTDPGWIVTPEEAALLFAAARRAQRSASAVVPNLSGFEEIVIGEMRDLALEALSAAGLADAGPERADEVFAAGFDEEWAGDVLAAFLDLNRSAAEGGGYRGR